MNLVEQLQRERVSQRGIVRVTGVSRSTIIRWLRKKVLKPIGETLLPTQTRPEIAIDEQWSYVGNKSEVVWHGVAVEHATRRVIQAGVGRKTASRACLTAGYCTRDRRPNPLYHPNTPPLE
jgi:hypothetical protein